MIEYPKSIWKLFQKKTTFVPENILFYNDKGRTFQLFEVVFTKLISIVSPQAKWTVTPIQGDDGIDFFGEQRLFKFDDIGVSASVKIGGQCKIRSSKESPIKSLSGDIVDMIDEISPIYVIVGFASKNDAEKIEKSQEKFTRQFNRPVYIFGLDEINYLIIKYLDEIKPILVNSLSIKESEQLLDYFTAHPDYKIPKIRYKSTHNISGKTGIPNSIKIRIESPLLSQATIKIRWIRPDYDKNNNILIIKPNLICTEEGAIYNLSNRFDFYIDFKFVSYIVGEQNIGKIEFEIDKEHKKTIDLGKIDLHDNYHPRFYWQPYEKERNIFNNYFGKIKKGCVEVISVTGEGGSGKTRLINELGIYGEQQGAEYITISQTHNYERPYHILGDLLFELISDKDYFETDYFEVVYTQLQKLNPQIAENANETLRIIFDKESHDSQRKLEFNKESLIQSILLLCLPRLVNNPLIIHFSDLHWCHHSVLSILAEFINKLKKVERKHRVPLLLIFEGRTNEISKNNDRYKLDYSTDTFEQFVQNNKKTITLRPFNKEHSLGFLNNIFENSQSNCRKVQNNLIPHQEVLINNIGRYGFGNPFHMLEQIKLLEVKGIIKRNKRTGLLFLIREIPGEYEVPNDVESLIKNRYNFIKQNTPDIANLIRAIALVQDRVSYKLFRKLLYKFTNSYDIKNLSETDMLLIPSNEYSEIKFRHENYYNVLKNIVFGESEKEQAIQYYLEWFEEENNDSAEILFSKALVLAKSSNPNHQMVIELLKTSKIKAKKQYQTILEQRILQHLLNHMENSDFHKSQYGKFIERAELKRELGNLLIVGGGDWNMASEQFEAIYDTLSNQVDNFREESQIQELHHLKYSVIANLANSYINQLKTHKSINLLLNNIDELRISYEVEQNPILKKELLSLYSSWLNRLGVAYWHDGNYKESLKCLTDGLEYVSDGFKHLSENDNVSSNLFKHVFLLDIGAVYLHFNANNALKNISKSFDLILDIDISPRYLILARITQIMAEIFHRVSKNEDLSYKYLIRNLEQLFFDAKKNHFTQEESASGLIIAILYALNNDRKCIKWFMDVINICFQNNLLETLWKTHLNLAQFEFQHKSGDKEASILHAQYVEDILIRDLGKRNIEERKHRLKHFRLPILKLKEILGNTTLTEYYINGELSEASKSYQDNILFLPKDENLYFLYGG